MVYSIFPCTSVDKSEYMIGSFGPSPDPVTKVVRYHSCLSTLCLTHSWHLNHLSQFAAEESPSGMMARSGSYVARSRIVDDDGTVWLDFEWGEWMLSCLHLLSYWFADFRGEIGFKIGKEWWCFNFAIILTDGNHQAADFPPLSTQNHRRHFLIKTFPFLLFFITSCFWQLPTLSSSCFFPPVSSSRSSQIYTNSFRVVFEWVLTFRPSWRWSIMLHREAVTKTRSGKENI